MRFLSLKHLIPLITGLLASVIQAQPESVNVQLSAITLSGKIRDLHYLDGSELRAFTIREGLRSSKMHYQGSPKLSFFRDGETTLNEKGETVPRILGSVSLPRPSGAYLLIFQKKPTPQENYQITVIPDDLATFQPGMYRFLNTAPYDIALKLGEARQIIPAKGYHDVRADTSGDYQTTIMISMINQGNDPVVSYSGSLFYSKDKRLIYVISPKSEGWQGRIEITAIPETL